MTCGKAIPNCESCAAVFGCNRCDVWCDTAKAWNTRTTDLSRLLEAMRRDAEGAKMSSQLTIGVWAKGDGYIRMDRRKPNAFDTIEAGVAQLKAIIDDAEASRK
jgi:organic radical activating enzyme